MMRSFLATFLALLPILPAQAGQSTFGLARSREAAALGRLPAPLEVAVADIVNYHRHRLPLPRDEREMMLQLRCGNPTVGAGGELVLQFGYTTAPGDDRADLPLLNLALVIDRSGSMAAANKLTQVKAALGAFVGRLRPEDRVALITYNGEATVDQTSREVGDGRWLREAIARIEPGGATNLHDGLMLGLRQVAAHARSDINSRVLLLTDGIANRGETGVEQILADATEFTAEDIDLSTIGVGRNLDLGLLDRLARGGRGLFHYVAEAGDINKVFVKEHEALVASVARRVVLEIELPAGLSLVRVVGHECRPSTAAATAIATIELPNQNRGATGVVMAVCRADARDIDRVVKVGGRLSYEAQGQRRSLRVDEEVRVVGSEQELLRDPEVRKNYTIAVLAEGMHEMAEQSACRRWADADRALQRALRFSRREFKTDDDADVARVRAMAEAYGKTLGGYTSRFRDI